MTTIHPSYGPGAGKFGHVNPDNTMRQILEAESDLEMSIAVNRLIKEAIEPLGEYVPSDLMISMLWSEGIRSYWRVTKMMEGKDKSRKDKKERDKAEAKEVVERALLSVARRMTGAQCAAAGGGFARLAKKVKPRQIVGDVLTDEQIVKELGPM